MDYNDLLARLSALVLVWCVFYGLVIRPGRVLERERQAAVRRLKPGDLVITTHGMRGVVRGVDDTRKFIEVEIAHEVVCSLDESGIARILPRPSSADEEVPATS